MSGTDRDGRQLPEAEIAPAPSGINWRWLGLLLVRLMLDAALVDFAIETWLGASPVRIWVAGPVVVYAVFSVWALLVGAKLAAPGIVTQTPAAFYVFLGILVAITQDAHGFSSGIALFKQPAAIVFAGTSLVVTFLAVMRIASPRGTPWWLRLLIVATGVYAAVSIGLGLMHAVPYRDLIHGQSGWQVVPAGLRGAFVGAIVLPPLAFVRELIVSMRVLQAKGYLRWMVVFGLASVIGFNAL